MANLHIDRLSLKLSGLSEQDGRRLSRLVAEGLAQADFSSAAPRRVETLPVNLTSPADGNVSRLSEEIVAGILRQLQRTV